jgi:hypothetical protein
MKSKSKLPFGAKVARAAKRAGVKAERSTVRMRRSQDVPNFLKTLDLIERLSKRSRLYFDARCLRAT